MAVTRFNSNCSPLVMALAIAAVIPPGPRAADRAPVEETFAIAGFLVKVLQKGLSWVFLNALPGPRPTGRRDSFPAPPAGARFSADE